MSDTNTTSICFNSLNLGTADFVVASAFPNCVTPEQTNVIDGKVYGYYAESADRLQWEQGSGVYTIASHTLSRTTITATSNGDQLPVNFTVPQAVSLFPSAAGLLEPVFAMQDGSLTATWPNAGDPAVIGTSDPNAALRLHVGSVAVDQGVYRNGTYWIQPRIKADLATNLPISLNPNGGNVAIGKAVPNTALDVNGTVTASTLNVGTLSETTGGAWTSYTPTVGAAVGSFTTVAASGRYRQLGKTIFFTITVSITTNGIAAGSVLASVPFTAGAGTYIVAGRENLLAGKMLQGVLIAGGTNLSILNYDNSYPGGNGTSLVVSGIYEAA